MQLVGDRLAYGRDNLVRSAFVASPSSCLFSLCRVLLWPASSGLTVRDALFSSGVAKYFIRGFPLSPNIESGLMRSQAKLRREDVVNVRSRVRMMMMPLFSTMARLKASTLCLSRWCSRELKCWII